MRPMIDQMFRGRAAPEAGDAVRSTFSAIDPSRQSLSSNLTICTSSASFDSTLKSHEAVAVMFTSKTCPPCEAIKPYFEELARTHGQGKKRIEFVLVEMGVGDGSKVASEQGVRATPTFGFFARGQKVSECKGADRGELSTQVKLLKMEVWPRESHSLSVLLYTY